MQILLIVGGLVLLVALGWLAVRQRAAAQGDQARRSKARSREGLDTLMSWQPQPTRVLTAPERKAYLALRAALPEHIILAQVPLARFLKVPTRHSYSEWLRRVGVLCGDLVVCDGNSQVVAVVDVRAPESQENDRTRQRHRRMDRVLEAAGIPLHIWREDALPNMVGARRAILGDEATPETTTGRATAPGEPVSVIEDDSFEQRDPPSTWFDDMDSALAPLTPAAASPLPHRGGGPSIR